MTRQQREKAHNEVQTAAQDSIAVLSQWVAALGDDDFDPADVRAVLRADLDQALAGTHVLADYARRHIGE